MSESDEDARLFGRIAERQRFVTQDQLREALRERARSGQKLGAVMLANGMIDKQQLAMTLALLKRHRERKLREKEVPPRQRSSNQEQPPEASPAWRPLRRPGQPAGRSRGAVTPERPRRLQLNRPSPRKPLARFESKARSNEAKAPAATPSSPNQARAERESSKGSRPGVEARRSGDGSRPGRGPRGSAPSRARGSSNGVPAARSSRPSQVPRSSAPRSSAPRSSAPHSSAPRPSHPPQSSVPRASQPPRSSVPHPSTPRPGQTRPSQAPDSGPDPSVQRRDSEQPPAIERAEKPARGRRPPPGALATKPRVVRKDMDEVRSRWRSHRRSADADFRDKRTAGVRPLVSPRRVEGPRSLEPWQQDRGGQVSTRNGRAGSSEVGRLGGAEAGRFGAKSSDVSVTDSTPPVAMSEDSIGIILPVDLSTDGRLAAEQRAMTEPAMTGVGNTASVPYESVFPGDNEQSGISEADDDGIAWESNTLTSETPRGGWVQSEEVLPHASRPGTEVPAAAEGAWQRDNGAERDTAGGKDATPDSQRPHGKRAARRRASRLQPAAPVEAGVKLEPLPWGAPSPNVAGLRVNALLTKAVRRGASDVHLHAEMKPTMRRFSRLVPLQEVPLTAEQTRAGLMDLLTTWQTARLAERGEIDFAYEIDGVGRFRANIYEHHLGLNGVFHAVPADVPTLQSLGLPPSLKKLTSYSQGMILLTGPAGAGKTSTLAALIDIINESRDDHILTIEDPIEYLHASKRCIVNQRQVGRHTHSFARGLRGALREDPDIICIGELRDLETISLAMSAAETGHLVLATLHTGSAVGTINRVVGSYPPGQQPQIRSMLGESLRAVVTQRMLPTKDGAGAVPALEILYITKAVANLIRDNRTFQIASVMQTGRAHGMQTLDNALKQLLDDGQISREVALANCVEPRTFGGENGAR